MVYYRQQQQHTCAIACIRMILSNENEPPSEGVLISLLRCTEKDGTSLQAIKTYFKWIGYEIAETNNLETLTKNDYLIIAVIQKQDKKHAVVIEYRKNFVKIFDPALAIYEMQTIDFERVFTEKFVAVKKM